MFTRIGEAAYKKDLTNTLNLLEFLGNPHKNQTYIHVAGTNGKGSVSHFLASICMEAGLKVGLYTSPHLLDFRERIQINGEYIPEDFVIDFTEKLTSKIEEIEPSFFELTVAMALDYFAKNKVDIAIIETGLGGRLDSTNVILPSLSVITNISFDHQNMLGNTLQEIAYEKAGIIKPMIPVVIGTGLAETLPVFKAKAEKECSLLIQAEEILKIEDIRIDESGVTVILHDTFLDSRTVYSTPLGGTYQAQNIRTAVVASLSLKPLKIEEVHIRLGIKNVIENTKLMGRWQTIHQDPDWVADVGHNEDGLAFVFNQSKMYPSERKFLLIGFVKDKNREKLLTLIPEDFEIIVCQPSIPRGLQASILADELLEIGRKSIIIPDIKTACQYLLNTAKKDDFILSCGSFFVVSEVLEFFRDK